MNPFNTASDFILDLIFVKLNEEDLHETLRVSKSWFWASIRRIKKLKIHWQDNPLKSIATFYNIHRPPNAEELDWPDLFKHLLLDELVVDGDDEAINYLVNNGCNTAVLAINSTWTAPPVTLESLSRITRLQSFKYRTRVEVNWHPFVIECFKSTEFDPNMKCPINVVKLNSSGWITEDPVLQSVTKLGVCNVTVDFLRSLVDLCPNLEKIQCFKGAITQDWHQVFPANVKRIELHGVRLDDDVATIVDATTHSVRYLLPYLSQNWESVEKFHFDDMIGRTFYQAFPQQREEVFVCEFNETINLASTLFQCRKIRVKYFRREHLENTIPAAKIAEFEFDLGRDFEFSPRAVCSEPGKVERLALLQPNSKPLTHENFGPKSFEGFSRLTSLTLMQVSPLTVRMALDLCPSIKKLKLVQVEAMTLGNIPGESSYLNVCELILRECEDPLDKIFLMFPRLSKFKHSVVCGNKDIRKKTSDWLCQELIQKDKSYGVVSQTIIAVTRYMVSDNLQESLNQAQKMLNNSLCCGCYLKGFKLLPRFASQKVIYLQ